MSSGTAPVPSNSFTSLHSLCDFSSCEMLVFFNTTELLGTSPGHLNSDNIRTHSSETIELPGSLVDYDMIVLGIECVRHSIGCKWPIVWDRTTWFEGEYMWLTTVADNEWVEERARVSLKELLDFFNEAIISTKMRETNENATMDCHDW